MFAKYCCDALTMELQLVNESEMLSIFFCTQFRFLWILTYVSYAFFAFSVAVCMNTNCSFELKFMKYYLPGLYFYLFLVGSLHEY